MQFLVLVAPSLAQSLDAAQQQEVDALTKQIEANPNDPGPLSKRGFIFKTAKIWEKAAPDFERCLVLNPQWQQGYIFRAEYLEKHGRVKEAISALDKAEAIEPLPAMKVAWRGDLFVTLKEYKPAIAEFSKAVALSPDDYRAYAARAGAKLSLYGPCEDVVKDLEKSIAINPSYKIASLLLEDVRQRLKSENSIK